MFKTFFLVTINDKCHRKINVTMVLSKIHKEAVEENKAGEQKESFRNYHQLAEIELLVCVVSQWD